MRRPVLTWDEVDRPDQFSRFTAYVAVFLVGVNVQLPGRITTATVVTAVLLPVWFRAFSRYRSATTVLILAIAAVVSGLLLTWFAESSRASDAAEARGTIIFLATSLMVLGLLLWARQVIPIRRIVLLYGVATLLSAIPDIPESANAWKYQLSIPVSLIVLSLLGRSSSLRSWLIVLGALGAIGIVTDSRSFAGLCAVTALILVWYQRPTAPSTRSRRLQILLVGLAGLAAFYFLASSLLVSGYLGEDVQQRTELQVQQGGSVIVGGRPEIGAATALITKYPMGFGLGAVPTMQEVFRAKEGLASVGLIGQNNYVDRYMFGTGFELHSIISDFWAWFGLVGLALALYVGWLLAWGLTKPSTDESTRPIVVFTSVFALWFLAFGTPVSNMNDVILALGLALPLLVTHDTKKETSA